MADRGYPYGNFNYRVNLGGRTGDGDTPIGGFSEVNGLNTEMTYAEYRAGNMRTNSTIRVPNIHKTGTLTLKRGVMGTTDLWEWLKAVRDGAYQPRTLTITMLDETREKTVLTLQVQKAQPQKWTAPTLMGKGGSDVAMEEFVLVYESVEVTEG